MYVRTCTPIMDRLCILVLFVCFFFLGKLDGLRFPMDVSKFFFFSLFVTQNVTTLLFQLNIRALHYWNLLFWSVSSTRTQDIFTNMHDYLMEQDTMQLLMWTSIRSTQPLPHDFPSTFDAINKLFVLQFNEIQSVFFITRSFRSVTDLNVFCFWFCQKKKRSNLYSTSYEAQPYLKLPENDSIRGKRSTYTSIQYIFCHPIRKPRYNLCCNDKVLKILSGITHLCDWEII